MKLSLTIISKDGEERLKNLLPKVKQHVDEIIVVIPPEDSAKKYLESEGVNVIVQDFTQAVEPEIIEKMAEWGIEVDEDYRLFNFAAARNVSLEAATGDYVLWLDDDDEPQGIENLREFIIKNPNSDVFYANYDYYRDDEGNSVSDHIRERVVRRGEFTWKGGKLGLIHETLLPTSDLFDPLSAEIDKKVFQVKHHSDHVDASSMRNHVALLYEYIKTNGEDPRTTLYLGVEFFNRGMFEDCIKIMLEYVKVGGSIEDRFSAWLKVGEAYELIQRPESARNAFLTAMTEMPNRPDAYLQIGESYFNEKQWVKAIDFIQTGLSKKMPKTMQILDVTRYTFRPAVNLCLAYLELDKPDDAFQWFVKAAKMNPNHPWIRENAHIFKESKDIDEYVKAFVKLGQLSQKMYPKTLPKLATAIPDDLMSQDLLLDFKARYTTPKIWSNKSVVFFCSSAFEDWGPESLVNGCGGSEEAVIQLSKELVKLGWEVTVFNNCIKEQVKNGVNWVRFERFNPRDIFNVLISWRHNSFLDPKIASKKFIDMHDVPTELRLYPEKDMKDVKIMVKSQYHRTTFPTIKNDDIFVQIPNGIDTAQFENPEKTKNNLVWTSSYDRGLENLLKMWPTIRKEVPDATLDVYYGFELYDTTTWGANKAGQQWKQYMLKLLDQEGVTDYGRVGTDVVAEAYKKADIWAYPTQFPEIDCITATKAMAAKCVPITTDFAVMKERNQGVMVEGDINTPEVFEKFQSELIALLKDENKKEEIRAKLDVTNYSWSEVAKLWQAQF
jgi:glycosyltransferase involved in cell wall biosynthesis